LYDLLEQRLVPWAESRSDVLAMVIIGSRARTHHPADEWSDLDTILFTTDPDLYAPGLSWQAELETRLGLPVWFAAHSRTERGDRETEFVLQDGLKLDIFYMRASAAQGSQATLQQLIESAPYRRVFANGTRVLFERNPSAQPLRLDPPADPEPPDQVEFANRIANYLLELTRAMKLARRGELWRAARAVNEELQGNLLTLLEWQARLRPAPAAAVGAYGRFLEDWADPRALAALPATYADSTLPGVRRAVRAALDLLDWLAPEIAQQAGLSYTPESLRPTLEWLRSL
jgi:aminoglycoside 6-adenylyltransferase